MEYDLYSTDDRRYARTIQPDAGESLSGSSHVDSGGDNEPGNYPVNVVTVGEIQPSSPLLEGADMATTGDGESVISRAGSEIDTQLATQISHDPSMLPHLRPTNPSSGRNQERVENQFPDIGTLHISRNVTGEDPLTNVSVQESELSQTGQEEPGNMTNETPGDFEHGLGAYTASQGSDAHGTLGTPNTLGPGMDYPDDDGGVPSRGVSQAGYSRRTASSRERTRSHSVQSNHDIREIILPRWQPDVEVTYCPICRTQFSFFVRKHHCRKCGRVVCNACSPHRITIPYQFIVQPPPAVGVPSTESVSQSGPNTISHVTGAMSDFADRNGGMKVRLCNPCVPDPNPLPPQPQYSDVSGQAPTLYLNSGSRPYSFTEDSTTGGGSGRLRGLSAASGLRPSEQRPQQRSTSPYNPHNDLNMPDNGSNSPYPSFQPTRYPGHMPHADPLRVTGSSTFSASPSPQLPFRAHRGQNRGHANRHQSLSFIPGGTNPNPQPHYRSLLDIGSDQYTRTSPSSNRPLPAVPHVNEEDECPVCHRVLFSRTLSDFENLRAAHIMQCIDEQIALHSGTSSRPSTYTSQSQPSPSSSLIDLSPPPPGPPTPLLANTPEARTAARERAHAAVVLGATSSGSSTPPGRRTGIFVYRASEKDCVDDAECTICLEEFEVGASMARLECFCRFHKKCIQDWFVDHPGRCPVHQHDGYGF